MHDNSFPTLMPADTPLRKELFQTITTAAVKEIFRLTDRSLHAPHTAWRKAPLFII